MSWTELAGLAAGGWEIGSHTCSHPHLTQLDDGVLQTELVQSRRACEEMLQQPCRTIAYPYGDHDDRVVDATGAAGYSAACTLPVRFSAPAPLRYPRIGVYHEDDDARFKAKVSPLSRRLRGSPAWPVATHALRALRGH